MNYSSGTKVILNGVIKDSMNENRVMVSTAGGDIVVPISALIDPNPIERAPVFVETPEPPVPVAVVEPEPVAAPIVTKVEPPVVLPVKAAPAEAKPVAKPAKKAATKKAK